MLDRSREFIELVMCLNYAKAARKLNLSTSTLSRHIADLERELGFPLLERNPLRLTNAGQCYLESISTIIADLDLALERAREVAHAEPATLNVYYMPSHSVYYDIIQEAASRLEQEFPYATVRLFDDNRSLTTYEALLEGAADVGSLLPPLPEDGAIATSELVRLPVCAWVTRTSPLARITHPTLADLARAAVPVSVDRFSQNWSESIVALLAESGAQVRTHLRTLEDKASFYRSLRDDEVLIDFADDASPQSINPNLVRIDLQHGHLSAVVFIARRADDDNPLAARYVELALEIAGKHAE